MCKTLRSFMDRTSKTCYVIIIINAWTLYARFPLSVALETTSTTATSMTERPLSLLGLLPSSGAGWTGGQACLAPIYMAMEDIRVHKERYKDILQGYDLTYSWVDTQCSPGVAVYAMEKEMYGKPPYVMVLGDGCSVASEATAQVSYLWNITQLSYGSSSPILSDRKRFPKFFRLSGPDNMLNPARLAMMDMFKWQKVATINQAMEFFSVVIDDFVKRIKDTHITILSQEIFGSDPMTRIENLKTHDARIIIAAMYEDKARKVLCAAYKVGLYGPRIVWMFTGWFSKAFWHERLDDVDCSAQQMDAVAEGAILMAYFSRNPVEERGIANITALEFDERLVKHPAYKPQFQSFDRIAGKCYDHIWMVALALDCADKKLKSMGHPKTLDQFTYADADMNEVIFECMGNVTLTGVTGKFAFEAGADPTHNIKLEQIRGSTRALVGQYRMDTHPRRFEWYDGGIKWKDGNVPRDSTHVIHKEVTIPLSVYIPMAACSSLGIAVAIALLVFNVVHRQNKAECVKGWGIAKLIVKCCRQHHYHDYVYVRHQSDGYPDTLPVLVNVRSWTVKMSSPNINNVLLLGCILCYITVYMKPTETSNSNICKARDFCFTLGFTITFGSLFSKTWRVYRIFTNKKLLRMKIKDYQLLAIICGLMVVILSVLIAWEIISPKVIVVKSLDKEMYLMGNDEEVRSFVQMCQSENSSYFSWILYVNMYLMGNDEEVRPFVQMCQSENSSYFSWILYVMEGALLSFGAFLAWETRHVKIEALNDSHQIGLCLYNVVVLSAVGLTLNLLLDQQIIILYGMTSGCLIIGTTVIQVVVFLPKVQAVYKKSTVGDVSTRSASTGQSGASGARTTANINISGGINNSSGNNTAGQRNDNYLHVLGNNSNSSGNTNSAQTPDYYLHDIEGRGHADA